MSRRKYIGKPHSKFIKKSISQIMRIDNSEYTGYVSLLNILEINQPLLIKLLEKEFYLYGNGYFELCYLPDNENWQVYGIYDNYGKIIEWYFDITRKNTIDEYHGPYCEDLYLDIVLMPDGKSIILDEDELLTAYKNGNITKEEYDMAYIVKDNLIKNGIVDIKYLERMFNKFIELFRENE